MTEEPTQPDEPEPMPGCFSPMRQVRGAPAGVLKRAQVGEPEYDAALAELRAKHNAPPRSPQTGARP